MKSSDSTTPGLPDIRIARREIHHTRYYSWDNTNRLSTRCLVIQRTVRGSCRFRSGDFEQEVIPEFAMLFRHGDHSHYDLGPNSKRPYETEYAVINPDGGIAKLFINLRKHCGHIFRMETGGKAHQLLLQLILEFESSQPSDRITHASLAYELLLNLYREQGSTTHHRDPVAYGRHLLETRYRESKNLKEWCAEIGISREHFSREFNERYHESPSDFLRDLRLQHARSLLGISTHLPLENIASLSGFSSLQTFRRAYKQKYNRPIPRTRG